MKVSSKLIWRYFSPYPLFYHGFELVLVWTFFDITRWNIEQFSTRVRKSCTLFWRFFWNLYIIIGWTSERHTACIHFFIFPFQFYFFWGWFSLDITCFFKNSLMKNFPWVGDDERTNNRWSTGGQTDFYREMFL